jgi:hypothetical protein
MAKIKKYAAGGPTSPEAIVAEIDRKQNEEDRDLIPRAGRMLRDKINEDLTGGAYVGNRLDVKKDATKNSEKAMRILGKAKGGAIKSSASKRADGCAIRGKTKGRMV